MAAAYHTADSTAPAHGAVVVTPTDGLLIPVTRGIYVGVTGNLAVQMADGQTVTFTALPVGFHPIQAQIILATGTTATNILALY